MEITPQPTKRNPQWFKGRRGAIGAFAAAAALIVAVFAITSVINSDSDVADRGPAETIEAYIAAYNTGDLEVVMELFTEEAVITDHPFALTSVGLAAIRSVQFLDLQGAAAENPYTISNVVATGNTVTWDHVWITREGDRSCRYGHRAVVADGKILTWTWPGGGHTSCR